MKAKWTMRLVAMALGILMVSSAWAQPPGGMRGMRDNPKRHLERFIMGVGLLEKNGKAKLTSSQAKKIVTLVSPWRSKSSMSESQAKDLDKKLEAVLTSAQKNELKSLRPRRRDGERRGSPDGERRGGGRRGGPDGEWGGRGPGRDGKGPGGKAPTESERKEFKQRMEKMQSFYKTYNPFYPPTNYQTVKSMPPRMQESFKRRYAATSALLTQLSRKGGNR